MLIKYHLPAIHLQGPACLFDIYDFLLTYGSFFLMIYLWLSVFFFKNMIYPWFVTYDLPAVHLIWFTCSLLDITYLWFVWLRCPEDRGTWRASEWLEGQSLGSLSFVVNCHYCTSEKHKTELRTVITPCTVHYCSNTNRKPNILFIKDTGKK